MRSHVDDQSPSNRHLDPRSTRPRGKRVIFVISSPEQRFAALETLFHLFVENLVFTCDASSPTFGQLGRDDFRIFAIWHYLPFRVVTVHCHRPPVDDESPSCRRPFPCASQSHQSVNKWRRISGRISDNCLKTKIMLITSHDLLVLAGWLITLAAIQF